MRLSPQPTRAQLKTSRGCRMLVSSGSVGGTRCRLMSETRPQTPHGGSLIGEVLGGYRITGELASGGMGAVYRANHELLDRPAAIKLLRPELSGNDVLIQRFFNEAKAASAIHHPGIIEVYDFGYSEDGRAYIVMELLDGEPLGARRKRRGQLSELETAAIMCGIASALTAAHAKGIVHRDLKPDNVFLIPDAAGHGDRVKVLDFGVAKLADSDPSNVRYTQTGALMGTPLYMAPEQARAAGKIDHRADLYSLGCIAYELLVGRPPFVAEGAGEIIALQLFSQAQRPSELVGGLSQEIDAIVMRLLEKEPQVRYQSAAEVQLAFAALGAPAGARPPMPGGSFPLNLIDERPAPEQRSSMPIVAGVITVVLAAAGAIFVVTRSSDDAPAKPPAAAVVEPAPVRSVPPPPPPPPAPAMPVDVVEPVAKQKPKPAKAKRIEKPAETSGPVVAPEPGPAHPGMHTADGAPIEPDLGPPPKPGP